MQDSFEGTGGMRVKSKVSECCGTMLADGRWVLDRRLIVHGVRESISVGRRIPGECFYLRHDWPVTAGHGKTVARGRVGYNKRLLSPMNPPGTEYPAWTPLSTMDPTQNFITTFRCVVAYTFSDATAWRGFIGNIRQAKSIIAWGILTFPPHVALLFSLFSRTTPRCLGLAQDRLLHYYLPRVWIKLGKPFRTLGIERHHVGLAGFNPIVVRMRLGHVVDWSSCLKMMDDCDRMATWYACVLATNTGAGRCRQIRGKRLTIVYPGDATLGATVCTCIVRSCSAIHGGRINVALKNKNSDLTR